MWNSDIGGEKKKKTGERESVKEWNLIGPQN